MLLSPPDAPETGQGERAPSGTKPPSSEEDACRQRLDQAQSRLLDALVAQRLVDPEDRRQKSKAEAEAKVELAKARKDPVAEAEAKVELAKARKDPVAEKAEVEVDKARKDVLAGAMGTCLFQHFPVVMCKAFAGLSSSRAVLYLTCTV
jgi:hypothetical protein